VRRELSIGEAEVLIAAVGNLYAVKGHIVLLRALARLEDSGAQLPRWRVAIAGRGAEEAALRDFATVRGWAERVHLLGFREDAADVVAAADVFAMPSLSEGLPLAIIEAMFAGRAIVASRTGGIPEVVTDGAEALLAAPGDDADLAERLHVVLTSRDLRARLGDAAHRRAAFGFTLERMADEYERIYYASTGRTPSG
jgi:glycosyltransferase involved in cell wall biosynthesis